jgi:HEAT repeat protein
LNKNDFPTDTLLGSNSERRQQRLEELALDMDDATAEKLLEIAESDQDENIRADVIVSFGPIIDECGTDYEEDFGFGPELLPSLSKGAFESMVRRLRAIYEDPAQPTIVRRRSMEVLVRDPQPWQRDAIRRDFASGERDWRLTAIFSMGYHNGFDKEILQLVESGEGDLRFEAVRAAGLRSLKEAGPTLRKLARSSSVERDLRIVAILSLPPVDPDCRELLQSLRQSGDKEISAAADEALDELAIWEMDDPEEDDEFGDDDED